MCGIAGIISTQHQFVNESKLQKMTDTLIHRGPDAQGFWMNSTKNIGFAHRRLSIIDLTTNSNQPFTYQYLRIVFNGEIYNYLELKEFLHQKGFSFSTQSDTEVILAAYIFWGKECLHEFDGMFAFAIFDEKNNEVFLARDRFGEKPLFYTTTIQDNQSHFYFASEMKTFWVLGVEKQIHQQQLLNYLTLGFTSNPINKSETFYKNVFSLPPAHSLTIQLDNNAMTQKKWYTLSEKIDNKFLKKSTKNDELIIKKFSALFGQSIQQRLRSDVSIGTSLSGGIDSSSIVANIHQLKNTAQYQPNTFTASFPGFEKDETQYSKAVAQHFQLNQYFTTPTAQDLSNHFNELMYHQEEPLQSSSVFTQYLVYKLAKENNVTVLLDGQGADEILGGYKKYSHWFLQELLSNNLSRFHKEKALLLTNKFLNDWNYKNYFAAFLPLMTSAQLSKKAENIQASTSIINKAYLHQFQNKKTLQKPVIKSLNDILYFDTIHFGLEDLLRYADRNSMAHSREVRLPFLNHQLVEFLFSLPSHYKIRNGFTKWLLRESVKNILPKEIVWRKGKIGYEPPQKNWMQTPEMKELIIESRRKLIHQNILQPSALENKIMVSDAHELQNLDWRILCAASIFKK